MRISALLAVGLIWMTACGGTAPNQAAQNPTPAAESSPTPASTQPPATTQAQASPSAQATVSPVAVPSPSPVVAGGPCHSLAPSYGLLLSGTNGLAGSSGTLEMVGPDGCVAASAPVSAPSQHGCAQGMAAVLAPPVSATNDKVFFRDGDTKIRFLTPTGETGDATTVPGGQNAVSFFSVSPDDLRIAVLVEDLSSSTTIGLQLYVEDLVGGGHHSVIYTSSVAMGKGGTTLWPMGWHNGSLALAVVTACTFEYVPNPTAWHISDATTGQRQATVGTGTCLPGWWPSPAGLTCVDYPTSQVNIYDWSGRLTATVTGYSGSPALSPTGTLVSLAEGGGLGIQSPVTTVLPATGGIPIRIPGVRACLWIDDSALLAPGAVIQYPGGGIVTELAGTVCAGRFPGGL